jgi:hypothetical protein
MTEASLNIPLPQDNQECLRAPAMTPNPTNNPGVKYPNDTKIEFKNLFYIVEVSCTYKLIN